MGLVGLFGELADEGEDEDIDDDAAHADVEERFEISGSADEGAFLAAEEKVVDEEVSEGREETDGEEAGGETGDPPRLLKGQRLDAA